MTLLKFASDFLPVCLRAVVSCFPGFRLWIREKERHLPRPSSAGLHDTARSRQKPPPTLRAPQAAACGRSTARRFSNRSSGSNSRSQNHLWLAKRFQEQTLAPGSRDIASPKFIQLNYVPLVGTGNTRRGSKRLQRAITELVRSNEASTPTPFKDRKCHQSYGVR